jgi:hypothetical protein
MVIKLYPENNCPLNVRAPGNRRLLELREIQYLHKLRRYCICVLRAESRHKNNCQDK